MNKRSGIVFFILLICCGISYAQQVSDLQKRAEADASSGNVVSARSLYIRAFEDYAANGQMNQAVQCGAKATALYYKENMWQESFDLLRTIDRAIESAKVSGSEKCALRYYTSKERMRMYMKMHRPSQALDHLTAMEKYANVCNDEEVNNDLLYTKATYYYSIGESSKGNAVFDEMAKKLTASKEYDKVDEVYRTLIAAGRRSNSASLVAQSYKAYMTWKDSVSVIKHADEIAALKKQIADNEASIAEKDSSLTTRMGIIIALCVLAGALAVALALGVIVLMRYILLTRKQQKTIDMANDNIALKAQFIGNISAQLEPTLKKLDKRLPEVQAMLDFTSHVQQLSELENTVDQPAEVEDVQLQSFCEGVVNQIRGKVPSDATLKVNVPKMDAALNQEFVSHVLLHLLNNAVQHVNKEGTITLEYKKRGPKTHQFLVSNTGEPIPEEKRDNVFKPFLEIRDLTEGDGLGLPICRQMALKMKGDLSIDPEFTKGTRFVLELHV
jgi:signal transduction histidine kinase